MSFFRFLQHSRPSAPRRICAVTVLSDSFVEYFLVLLFSIRKHNPWFDHDFLIIHSKVSSPLSKKNRKRITDFYPKAKFLFVDEADYARFTPDPRFFAALLKIEAFRIPNYDTVIFLDSDMLCLGDISYLFSLEVPFAACPPGKDAEKKTRVANTYRIGQNFNSGVMVIGKKYLSESVHAKILHARSGPHADQEILNPFFRFRRIYCLDHHYNYNAAFFWNGDDKDDPDVRILHFAGEKPLEKPDMPRMKIWFAYKRESGF